MANRSNEEQAKRLAEITSFSYSYALEIMNSGGPAKETALWMLESNARWQEKWQAWERARDELRRLTYA